MAARSGSCKVHQVYAWFVLLLIIFTVSILIQTLTTVLVKSVTSVDLENLIFFGPGNPHFVITSMVWHLHLVVGYSLKNQDKAQI